MQTIVRAEPSADLGARPWLGVEVRYLATLEAIARDGSFRRAALRLGYVQSAVSEHLSRLERATGTRLIERRRGQKAVTLTAAGEALLAHGAFILSQLEAARMDLLGAQQAAPGTLRVGMAASVAARFGPALAEVPGIELTEPAAEDDLPGLVERSAIHLAVGELPNSPRHETRLLVEDPYALLVRASSAQGREREPVTVAQLRELTLVAPLPSQGLGHAARHLRAHGVEAAPRVRSAGLHTVHALVGAGLGAAVLPRMAVTDHDPAIVAVDLDGGLPPRPVGIYWHALRCWDDRRAWARDRVVEALAAALLDAGEELEHRVAC